MEAVAWLACERHSDHPQCTCPVIAAYVGRIGDWASDERRQQLHAFLPRLIGSRSVKHVILRAEYLVRQAVTVFLPSIYERLKQPEIAAVLRTMWVGTIPMQLRESISEVRGRFSVAAYADAAVYAHTAAAVHANTAAAAYAAAGAFATDAIAAATYTASRSEIASYRAYDMAAALRTAAAEIAGAASAAAAAADAAFTAARYDFYSANSYIDKEVISAARETARQELWAAALEALDGALAIGPSGPATLTADMIEQLKTYRTLHQTSA
jgi:hypothetical protein